MEWREASMLTSSMVAIVAMGVNEVDDESGGGVEAE